MDGKPLRWGRAAMLLDHVAAINNLRTRRMLINPLFADWLRAEGYATPEALWKLDGPIISGHADRHVMRVSIGGRRCFLKREHRVPLRDRVVNWRAGYGFSSVSVGEAPPLQMLSESNFPVPPWTAAGESADGRAF